MMTNILVQHPSELYFTLSDAEFQRAAEKYASLLIPSGISFFENSATAGICADQDGYFDNFTVLSQFQRLFILLSFKEDCKGHEIEIVVDNARTHTAHSYSVNDFPEGIDRKCPVDFIECTDENGHMVPISWKIERIVTVVERTWDAYACYYETQRHSNTSC